MQESCRTYVSATTQAQVIQAIVYRSDVNMYSSFSTQLHTCTTRWPSVRHHGRDGKQLVEHICRVVLCLQHLQAWVIRSEYVLRNLIVLLFAHELRRQPWDLRCF